jgi:hypothetical protein
MIAQQPGKRLEERETETDSSAWGDFIGPYKMNSRLIVRNFDPLMF